MCLFNCIVVKSEFYSTVRGPLILPFILLLLFRSTNGCCKMLSCFMHGFWCFLCFDLYVCIVVADGLLATFGESQNNAAWQESQPKMLLPTCSGWKIGSLPHLVCVECGVLCNVQLLGPPDTTVAHTTSTWICLRSLEKCIKA